MGFLHRNAIVHFDLVSGRALSLSLALPVSLSLSLSLHALPCTLKIQPWGPKCCWADGGFLALSQRRCSIRPGACASLQIVCFLFSLCVCPNTAILIVDDCLCMIRPRLVRGCCSALILGLDTPICAPFPVFGVVAPSVTLVPR